MENLYVDRCTCRGSYVCIAHRKDNTEPEGSIEDNPVPIFSEPYTYIQQLILYVVKNHKPYKHKSGWVWCTQCNDANHGASESQPKWPCDAYALAQAIVSEMEKV